MTRRGFAMAMAASPAAFNVKEYRGVQEAVDGCARSGGGTVWFPAGVYRSGTIVLKSHVTLHLEAGAVLEGSTNLADYPLHVPAQRSFTDTYTDKSLIYAEGAENVAIRGEGTIGGKGAAFRGPYKVRPYLMRFVSCRNVSVSGVTIKDSPMWVQHYLACDGLDIRGITVSSQVNSNNDGIDIDGCRRVRISDCDIISGDDAIVLKATTDRPCSDVVIANCVLSTHCNALKLGTESNGGFSNIAISNCTIYDTRLAGIAIEMVDGGVLERVSVSNILMNGVGAPIFVRLGNRARPFTEGGPRPPMGKMSNVSISHVQADGCGKVGCSITGLPGHAVENVTLDDIRLSFAGGGSAADARREVPEVPEKYPEFGMFGTLPAHGIYARHVKRLSLRNVQVATVQADARPALVCDDVEELELAGGALSSVRLAGVRGAFVHGCRSSAAGWLRVEGAGSRGISAVGNDLAPDGIDAAGEVARDAVKR